MLGNHDKTLIQPLSNSITNNVDYYLRVTNESSGLYVNVYAGFAPPAKQAILVTKMCLNCPAIYPL